MMERKSPYLQDNPPGFLRKSIERNWSAPANFVSTAEQDRQRKQAGAEQNTEEKRFRQEQRENERLCRDRKKRADESPWRDLWGEVCEEMAERINPQSYEALIAPCFISCVGDDNTVAIDCPSCLEADLVEEYYHYLLKPLVSKVRGVESELEFISSEESIRPCASQVEWGPKSS